jgi:hypothetical protein
VAGEVTGFLVHAAHVQQGPGRQTETAEARWWATLRRHGVRQASGIPALAQRDGRELTRDRTRLVPARRREVKRVPGVWARATITLAAVATDLMGGAARALVAAVGTGRADPATRAELATRRRRRKMPRLE